MSFCTSGEPRADVLIAPDLSRLPRIAMVCSDIDTTLCAQLLLAPPIRQANTRCAPLARELVLCDLYACLSTPSDVRTRRRHGTRSNRDYIGRYRILLINNYDPARDVKVAPNGELVWASKKAALHRQVTDYFENRCVTRPALLSPQLAPPALRARGALRIELLRWLGGRTSCFALKSVPIFLHFACAPPTPAASWICRKEGARNKTKAAETEEFDEDGNPVVVAPKKKEKLTPGQKAARSFGVRACLCV